MNISPDQGPRVPQATPAGAGATPTSQPQLAPDGKPFRSLDDILHGLVQANPKATPMQIYQGASAYMPWMNHEDQIRMAQAMQQYRYDALGARNDRATQNIQEKYDALKQQNDQFFQRALANKDKLGALQAIAARKAQLQAQAQEVNAATFGNKNDPTTQALLQKIGAENDALDQQAAALQQGAQPGGAAQGGTPAPANPFANPDAPPTKGMMSLKPKKVSLLGGPGPRVPQPYGGAVG
jgi:hypothetical protein